MKRAGPTKSPRAGAPPTWLAGLARAVGASRVSREAGVLAEHATDRWMASREPDAVVFAESAADVAAVLRFANRRRLPVTARGAGCGYVGGCVPARGGIALSVARMNRIVEVHPADAVAVVQPGVITGDLADAARRRGMFYPPDPASLRESSIGGNIATNAGGPRCLKYGVTRQYVLGLEVALADGTLLRCGGRTHKNKTGLDLVGLFVGSEGVLGVVTEATLKLLPLPPTRAVVAGAFGGIARAARAVQAVFEAGFLPSAVEIADRFTVESARKVHGKDFVPPGDAYVLVEVDGREGSVRADVAALREVLAARGANGLRSGFGEEACEALWGVRRGFSTSLKASGLTKLNEDVTVPRGRLVELMRFCEGLSRRSGVPIACFGHAGDGNIHVNLMAGDYFNDAALRRRMGAALDELFNAVLQMGGAITGEHGIGLAKLRWWKKAVPPAGRRVHEAIKAALDPAGILNPGKFVGR